MPRPSLPFRRVRSSCSRIRSARANRIETLEARRLLSAAVESVQPIDPQFFFDPISPPIQVDLAAPIIPIFATPTPISEVIAIPAPDAELVEVTTPGEVFQPVVIGPFPTLPPVAADPIDQTDDQKIKDKSDKKEKKEKKNNSDRKEKNNRGGDVLAQVEDPIDNVITIDPVDGSFGGGGDDPLGLPPVSGGTDLSIGDGSTPQLPVIQIPDTNVPVIEVPIVAIPITELPVVDLPPTVIPPIDVPPVVTPPVDVPPTVTPPTDESPTVTPPPTDIPPTDTPPPSEPIVELPTDDGTDPVTERPTDEPSNPSKPVVDDGDDNVVRNPVTENPVEREPGTRQPDSSINPGDDVVSKPQENGDSLTPAPVQSPPTEPAVAQGDSSADNVDQRGDAKSAADDFADKAAAAAAVFSSAPVTLDDDVAAPAEGDQAAGEATVDAIEAVPAEDARAAGEAAQSNDESEETKYGRVGAGGASEESRRVVRRFSVHVQTLAELAVADPEQAQLAAGTLPVQSVAVVTAEGEQVEEEEYPAAMASFSPASPTTTANVHNIMAAVLAGATFVTIYWNRWRKRKLEEAAAAASKLAGLLRFDPLAVWLDDNRPRHRR